MALSLTPPRTISPPGYQTFQIRTNSVNTNQLYPILPLSPSAPPRRVSHHSTLTLKLMGCCFWFWCCECFTPDIGTIHVKVKEGEEENRTERVENHGMISNNEGL